MKLMIDGVTVDATLEQEQSFNGIFELFQQDQNPYKFALQNFIDSKANEKEYESGVSCISYLNSTNSTWASEASQFNAWRDSVFAYAYDYLAKAQNGQISNPTIINFLSGIPNLNWTN